MKTEIEDKRLAELWDKNMEPLGWMSFSSVFHDDRDKEAIRKFASDLVDDKFQLLQMERDSALKELAALKAAKTRDTPDTQPEPAETEDERNGREEFEKWYDGDVRRSQIRPDLYAQCRTNDAYMAWREAWNRSKISPANRAGWLTAEQIDHIAEINNHCEPGTDEVTALCNMARDAISLVAESELLFAKLRTVLDTIEKRNV